MQKEISNYISILKDKVKREISSLLSNKDAVTVASDAFKDYFGDTKASAFHAYYSEIISNKKLFLSDPNFLAKFKQQYSLQGVDNRYLIFLEDNKLEILSFIEKGEIATLYFNFFANAQIQHGDEIRSKNLGSFFAKLVHTFAPDKYCALDNPIKQYFGLGKESFYISFIVISEAYKEWSVENPAIIDKIKIELETLTKEKSFNSSMTNLKLLDLIFWYQANRS